MSNRKKKELQQLNTSHEILQKQLWDIVGKFWNPDIIENIEGEWKLKNPIYSDIKEGD
jgi:hypothetical protein